MKDESLDWSFVKVCYYLKKELGESVNDDYPWIRFKYYVDCMKQDSKEQEKEINKAKSK